jgi:hypothetical protein
MPCFKKFMAYSKKGGTQPFMISGYGHELELLWRGPKKHLILGEGIGRLAEKVPLGGGVFLGKWKSMMQK